MEAESLSGGDQRRRRREKRTNFLRRLRASLSVMLGGFIAQCNPTWKSEKGRKRKLESNCKGAFWNSAD
nr:hypothetical protein Iba_chr01fCG7830 [Ipomoea batatas]